MSGVAKFKKVVHLKHRHTHKVNAAEPIINIIVKYNDIYHAVIVILTTFSRVQKAHILHSCGKPQKAAA